MGYTAPPYVLIWAMPDRVHWWSLAGFAQEAVLTAETSHISEPDVSYLQLRSSSYHDGLPRETYVSRDASVPTSVVVW
jgi:hypothetical protein